MEQRVEALCGHRVCCSVNQVEATDRDTDRRNNISYSLQGYGTEPPNQYFHIHPVTGQLFVIKPLDRDAPNGRANYQFTVVAKDEPSQPWQFGYATVEVLPADINDNKPTFDPTKLQGSVDEHSKPGKRFIGHALKVIVYIQYRILLLQKYSRR